MSSWRASRFPAEVCVATVLLLIAPAAGSGAETPEPGSPRAKALALAATANLLLIPDGTNLRVMAFDASSGDLVDPDFVPADPAHLIAPLEAIVGPTGDTILLSDWEVDAVLEYDLESGAFLRLFAPAGGVDNTILNSPRGIALRGRDLLVTNGSPTNSDVVAIFGPDGTYYGNIIASGSGGLNSPWDVYQVHATAGSLTATDFLVSGSDSDAIHHYSLAGTPLANFAAIDSSPQQIVQLATGGVLVANYSGTQTGVVELGPDGSLVRVHRPAALNSFRGVYALPNGNLLTTTGAGVHEIDHADNLIETKIAGVAARYIHRVGVWREAPLLPAAATRADTEVRGDGQYLLGFRVDTVTDGTVWKQELATGLWQHTGAIMPTPVSNYSVASLVDATGVGLYLFGGRASSGACTNAVQAFYPATGGTATFAADPWPGAVGSVVVTPGAVAVVDNRAYVWGGFCGGTPAPYTSDETWIFDPMAAAGSRWSAGPDLPWPGSYQAAAVVDGKIYSIGGDTYDGASLAAYDSVFRLDPANLGAGWQVRASLPLASSGVAGCDETRAFGFDSSSPWELAGGIVLAGCGQWGVGDNMVGDSFLYRVASNAWTTFPALSVPRRNHAGAFLPESATRARIWVGGGFVAGGTDLETATAETFLVRAAAIFADGFETATVGAWSSHTP